MLLDKQQKIHFVYEDDIQYITFSGASPLRLRWAHSNSNWIGIIHWLFQFIVQNDRYILHINSLLTTFTINICTSFNRCEFGTFTTTFCVSSTFMLRNVANKKTHRHEENTKSFMSWFGVLAHLVLSIYWDEMTLTSCNSFSF